MCTSWNTTTVAKANIYLNTSDIYIFSFATTMRILFFFPKQAPGARAPTFTVLYPLKALSCIYRAWTRCTGHLHMHPSDAIRSRSQRVQTPSICFSGAKLSTCWPANTKRPPPRGALMEADGCHSRGALLTMRPMCWGRLACTPWAPSVAAKHCTCCSLAMCRLTYRQHWGFQSVMRLKRIHGTSALSQ